MFAWPYVWDCSGTKLNLHGVLSRHRLRRDAHSAVSFGGQLRVHQLLGNDYAVKPAELSSKISGLGYLGTVVHNVDHRIAPTVTTSLY